MLRVISILSSLFLSVVIFVGCDADLSTQDDVVSSNNTRASISKTSSFGSNPGNLAMYKYVPSGISGSAPLVIAMHGCTQTAQNYADSGWTDMANKYKFYVVFPEQNSGNNQNKCFNWFESGDISRGYGEVKSIMSMVDKMKSQYNISSVYVNGFSAGGYMAPAVYATYPDVISGMSVNSGGPYKCATSMTAAFNCMSPGVSKSASSWGSLVKGASSYEDNIVGAKVIIFQGGADYTVKEANAAELQKQWENVGAVVKKVILSGMGHNVPTQSGCGSGYSYTDANQGICSAEEAVKYWGIDGSSGGDGDGDTGSGDGDGDGDTGSDCTDVTASNSSHKSAGRATSSSSSSGWWWYSSTTTTYYAVGSNDNLGTSGTTSTTLYSTDGGSTWNKGSCPSDGGSTGDGDGDTGVDSCNHCTSYACCVGFGCAGYSYVSGGMKCYTMSSSYALQPCSCWQ